MKPASGREALASPNVGGPPACGWGEGPGWRCSFERRGSELRETLPAVLWQYMHMKRHTYRSVIL